MKKIRVNAAQCRKCKTVVRSIHVHHFAQCKCGAIFVDGGLDYLRYGGNPEDFIRLNAETLAKTLEEQKGAVEV